MYGGRIKELRNEKGLTQAGLASRFGISASTLRMWELENSQPNITMIITMADFFGVTTDYLLGRSSDKTEVQTPEDILQLPPMIRGKYQELKDKLLHTVTHCNSYYDFVFEFLGKVLPDIEWALQGTDDNAELARHLAEDGLLRYDSHMAEAVQADLMKLEDDTLAFIRSRLIAMIYLNYNRKVSTSEAEREGELEREAEELERKRIHDEILADMQAHD